MDEIEVDFDELEWETESAYLITIDDEKIWIPKSQATLCEKSKKVFVAEWLATEKGLI